MALYKTKIFSLENQVPREIFPSDFMSLERSRDLKIQSDWYDIERQHNKEPIFKGNLRLDVCFLFKSEKTFVTKDIDFLVRYIFIITQDIIHGPETQITSVISKKRLSSENNTIFCFSEDVEYVEDVEDIE
jgi:Holliday junction resolvase RusA-like endonuclease